MKRRKIKLIPLKILLVCVKVQVKKIYSGKNWYLVHERVEKEYD